MGSVSQEVFAKRGEQYYSLARDSKESDRLNLQHRLLEKNFGYLIHPSIPFSQPYLKIAEFATGTAIWLNDVSKLVDPTCKLDGYDISSAQFSSSTSTPANITLRVHDILKPLPEEFHGYYDIIAVRALVTALANDEWEIAVANLMQCLKPGGHLQWVDADLSPRGMKVLQSEALAPRFAIERVINILQQKWTKLLGRDMSSCNGLASLFRSEGFENIFGEMMSSDWNADGKTRTDCTVEVMTGIKDMIVSYAQMEGSDMTVDEALEVGDDGIREAKLGKAYLRLDWVIFTGRKPYILHDEVETSGA